MQRIPSTRLVRLFSLALLAGSATLAEARKVDYVDVGPADGIHINNGCIEVSVVNGEYAQASSNSVPFNLRMKAGCKGSDILKGAFISLGDELRRYPGLEADELLLQPARPAGIHEPEKAAQLPPVRGTER